jgi:hypothetical protein
MRRRAIVIAVLATAAEAGFLRVRTGKFAGKVEVSCREGHEFTTTWIPGFSLNALRLGPWRVQRCPVGHHWSVVTPVRTARTAAPTAPR